MLVCTIIYMLVAAAAVGAIPFASFADSPEPLALILRSVGQGGVAQIVATTAVVALPTVLLAFLYGQSRIFLAMARDGFLPRRLAVLSKRGTPTRITVATAAIVAVLAGLLPIGKVAALANAGTLIAFMAVGACLLVLRRSAPSALRPFRVRWAWLVGFSTIGGCLYLFLSLPADTLLWCLIWNALGFSIYALYGRRRSALASPVPAAK
jgi:APA family basic amino acid/polyamine antiporter